MSEHTYCYDCTKDMIGKGLPNDLQSSGKGTLLFAECTGCGDGYFDNLGIRTTPLLEKAKERFGTAKAS